MRSRPAARLALLAFASLSLFGSVLLNAPCVSAADVDPSETNAPVVDDFKIVGLRRVDSDVVLRALKSKKGEPLNQGRVTEDIRAIFATNLFRDISVKRLPSPKNPNHILLVYEVTEKPSIKTVDIVGNDDVSRDDVKGAIDVKVGTILNIDQLAKNVGKVRELYVDKGHYLAEVNYKITNVNRHEVDVTFVINENQKVEVKKITFLGNKHVTDDELKGLMQIHEGNLLSFITSAGTYKEEVFQADLYRLTSIYFDRGYINAKVLKPEVQIAPDRHYIYITIPIEEGQQYWVGNIDFAGDIELKDENGNILVRPSDVRGRVTLSPGEVFNRSKLFADLQRAADLYRDQGYAYANVTPNTRINPVTRIVDLNLEVERGDRVYFERIEVVGNTKTRDKVIRREARIYEGELFNATALEVTKARITALGFFESVNVTTERGSAADKMNVKIEIKEKSTGTFQVGAGFSSVESFIATAQISQQNFLGRGDSVSLQAQLSFGAYGRQIFTANYVEPYLADKDILLNTTLYSTQQAFLNFQRLRQGGSAGVGVPLTLDTRLRAFLTYTLEYIAVGTGNTFSLIPSLGTNLQTRDLYYLNQKGIISSVRADLQYDSRDNRLFPTRGTFDVVSVEVADQTIGSNFDFVRTTGQFRFYRPLGAGFVFKANADIGWIFSRDPEGVPISERFYLGGIYSIRGYNPRSVGTSIRVPVQSYDPSSGSSPFVIGGNKDLQLNLEVEFPIFEKAGIRGVVFVDSGNAYDDDQNFFYIGSKSSDIPPVYSWSGSQFQAPLGLLYSFGFGVRWFSPIGPLRFEWGIPLTKINPTDQNVVFQFTIGNFF